MAYFATERGGDELCALGHLSREIEYEVFIRYAVNVAEIDDADLDLQVNRLSAALGWRPARVRDGILAYYTLRSLPKLAAMQKETKRLDLDRVRAISEVVTLLYDLPQEDIFEEFDDYLVTMFTPKRDGAELPSPRTIKRKLIELVRKIDASLAPNKNEKKKRKDDKDQRDGACEVDLVALDQRNSQLTLGGNNLLMGLINKSVETTAKMRNLSKGETVKKLLLGEISPAANITLHLYAPKGEPESYYIPQIGWTDAEGTEAVAQFLADHDHRVVDLDQAAEARTNAYVPTDAIRAYVRARDGFCIFPGCEVEAERCQLDHRIPFDDGGETAPSNLFCLCQKHHNMKTDRRAYYVVDPVTADIVWLFEDGTYQLTKPDGIMGSYTTPQRPRWKQTIKQRIEKRTKRAAFDARCHATIDKYLSDADFFTCIQTLHQLEKTYALKFDFWPDAPPWVTCSYGEWRAFRLGAYRDGYVSADTLIAEFGDEMAETLGVGVPF
ncbi:HNH endonuclease signature motif containing protein [Corynebacterium sp. Q4381]|uniref:HNH endonuclease signature motif containing protein n=1 Tax=Corynebacterium sp. Marseille-Q4381 TaxID=3121597 RepID=UPI002FE52FDF